MENLILNIESATEVCSIAVSQSEQILSLREISGNNHSAQITILINDCLREAKVNISDLKAVAMSNGPGSYTSLRVGTSTAKGICYALDLPLMALDTLEALATASFRDIGDAEALYCPMIDARRMEVYCALFAVENDKMRIVEPTQALVVAENSFEQYFSEGKKVIFSGNGAAKCQFILNNQLAILNNLFCSARHLAPLSMASFSEKNFVNVAYHIPNYLKMPNITSKKKIL